MRLRFTKMQGAGNDFVVLDATRAPVELDAAQLRRLGDRRFGVGADQILMIEPARAQGIDFGYRIFNGGSGDEVEQCGNGARCFVRFVHEHGLSQKRTLRVRTTSSTLELTMQSDGRVCVDMGSPVFALDRVPFDARGLVPVWLGDFAEPVAAGDFAEPVAAGDFALWPIDAGDSSLEVAVLSMGNPHAVQFVADVDAAPVASVGPLIEGHARFPRRVNAGFAEIVDRGRLRLRVYERGAGETLACGTGACAAVVAGIRLGRLDAKVDVQARGGDLTIEWPGGDRSVRMTGPAETVFEGEIEL